MTRDVALFQITKIPEIAEFAFDMSDILFGETRNKWININYGGNIERVKLPSEKFIQFTIRGALETDYEYFEKVREKNLSIKTMIRREDIGVDTNIAGIQISGAYLAKVVCFKSITVEGFPIFESIQLIYHYRS